MVELRLLDGLHKKRRAPTEKEGKYIRNKLAKSLFFLTAPLFFTVTIHSMDWKQFPFQLCSREEGIKKQLILLALSFNC